MAEAEAEAEALIMPHRNMMQKACFIESSYHFQLKSNIQKMV